MCGLRRKSLDCVLYIVGSQQSSIEEEENGELVHDTDADVGVF